MNISMETDNRSGKLLAAYIRFTNAKVHRTIEISENTCYAHEDIDGNLIGIELLGIGEFTWIKGVSKRYNSIEIENALGNAQRTLATAA